MQLLSLGEQVCKVHLRIVKVIVPFGKVNVCPALRILCLALYMNLIQRCVAAIQHFLTNLERGQLWPNLTRNLSKKLRCVCSSEHLTVSCGEESNVL